MSSTYIVLQSHFFCRLNMKTVNKTLCVCLKSAGPEVGHLDPASVLSRPMHVSLLTATQLCWLTSAPLSLQSIINPQSYWSPTASPHCRVCSVCGGPDVLIWPWPYPCLRVVEQCPLPTTQGTASSSPTGWLPLRLSPFPLPPFLFLLCLQGCEHHSECTINVMIHFLV